MVEYGFTFEGLVEDQAVGLEQSFPHHLRNICWGIGDSDRIFNSSEHKRAVSERSAVADLVSLLIEAETALFTNVHA